MVKDPARLRSRLHEKDDRDYEFVVAKIQRLHGLPPQEQWEHFKAHPWDAVGIKMTAGGTVYTTQDARMRLRQIVERGLRAMGPAAERHDADKVYEELPRHFLKLAIEGADITRENAQSVLKVRSGMWKPHLSNKPTMSHARS